MNNYRLLPIVLKTVLYQIWNVIPNIILLIKYFHYLNTFLEYNMILV